MWPMVWIYQIVTGVTSVVGVPSTHLVFIEVIPSCVIDKDGFGIAIVSLNDNNDGWSMVPYLTDGVQSIINAISDH